MATVNAASVRAQLDDCRGREGAAIKTHARVRQGVGG